MSIPVPDYYRFLFEQCSDGVGILSPAWQIMDINPAFSEIFGVSKSKIAGTKFCSLFSDPSACNSLFAEMQQRGSLTNFPLKAITQNGVHVDCAVDSRIFSNQSGNISAYQVVFHVAHDGKKSSDRVIYEERLKAFGEMAGAAAHNFRNLLQIIVSGTRIALSNLESGNLAETKTSLEQLLGNMRSAGETARLLSHFANVKREKGKQPGRLFDLSQTVQKAIDMSLAWLETDPQREGIKIDLTSGLQPGLMVKGVQNDVLEAVINLIWNAADALPHGGKILVKSNLEGAQAVLRVKDNGVGIAKEHFDKIFQPFWTTKGMMAKGLGLTGSYGIISSHRGEITVESELGKGTTFIVKLPLAEQARAVTRIQQVQGIDFSYRILVVDDLEPLLRVLRGGLAQRGQVVFSALSGKEALEIFAANELDVVICDLAMPEMNGWQVGKAIKKACQERGIPKPLFLMLTGWSEELDREDRLADSGVDRVVEKPVDMPNLIKVIRELVQGKK
ncbi:MAG: response regulator [Desulfomonile tiedjei]|uniref:histidine kinase n=1 Tax=Desulfomonile tiedjei TaxID=2358 RepID=A0A9D6V6X5_9BACT|nr:response regulator [Desulfomonile tiedjei]